MKRMTKTLAAGSLLAFSPLASAEFSANIGATSNYVWRGATQTDDQAAISGGLDYAHDSGFYVGTWASNVNFGDDANGDGSYELDLYGGYGGSFGEFGFDVGLTSYLYPLDDDADFLELGLSGSFKFLTVGLAYTLDGDGDDDTPFNEGDIYYYASASFDVAEGWSVGGTIGHYDFDVPSSGDVDYTHGQVDLTKSAGDFGDFTLSASVADEEANGDNDPRVFVSWSKTF
jgi:uncharacterized protein (TIGR02001 family)